MHACIDILPRKDVVMAGGGGGGRFIQSIATNEVDTGRDRATPAGGRGGEEEDTNTTYADGSTA